MSIFAENGKDLALSSALELLLSNTGNAIITSTWETIFSRVRFRRVSELRFMLNASVNRSPMSAAAFDSIALLASPCSGRQHFEY
jgi:hypothetical protein